MPKFTLYTVYVFIIEIGCYTKTIQYFSSTLEAGRRAPMNEDWGRDGSWVSKVSENRSEVVVVGQKSRSSKEKKSGKENTTPADSLVVIMVSCLEASRWCRKAVSKISINIHVSKTIE